MASGVNTRIDDLQMVCRGGRVSPSKCALKVCWVLGVAPESRHRMSWVQVPLVSNCLREQLLDMALSPAR